MQKSTVVDSETGKSKDSRCAILSTLFSCHLCLISKMEVLFALLFIPLITFICRVRTSSGTFLARGRDKFIRNIEKKIADFTFIPVGM